MWSRAQVVQRLQAILTRPGMYAFTREALVAQVALLVEILIGPCLQFYVIFTEANTNHVVGLTDEIDDAFVARIKTLAKACVTEVT